MRHLLRFCCLLSLYTAALAAERYPFQHSEQLDLYIGQVETLRFQDVERVAVGNDSIISSTLLDSGELMLIPQAVGQTDLVIWLPGNRRQLLSLNVQATDPQQVLREVRTRLSLHNGLSYRIRASRVQILGEVKSDQQLQDIQNRLGKALLAEIDLLVAVGKLAQVRSALAHIEGLEVSGSDEWIQLSGHYGPEHESVIDQVLARYPQAINAASLDHARLSPMVLVDVQIMEVRSRDLERLGIRWDTSIAGPAAAISAPALANPYFRANGAGPAARAINDAVPIDSSSTFGAIGLASQIASRIELMQQSGSAKLLARPMLSTRNGSASRFHSGGELPYPVIDARTGAIAVDFREYGVELEVLPRISSEDDLLIEVSAQVSTVDNAINVNGVPGLISKSVNSVISTRAGDTVVLSGLISNELEEAVAKVPWLGDIPLLGSLFRARQTDGHQRELAIFLTPRIRTPQAEVAPAAITALDQLGDRLQEQVTQPDWLQGAIRE